MKLFTAKKEKMTAAELKAKVMNDFARLQETVQNSRTIEQIIFNTK